MRAYDLIKKKRDGGALNADEVHALIRGYTSGEIADYQMAAFAMAVFFRGMESGELSHFTEAMLRSGEVVDLTHVPGVKVDKHSTGGVGDKISLPLAPAVAACGVPVPMVSGRGLGHTGGTLDKLESIPGFCVQLSTTEYKQLVERVGCCLIGQTGEVAPADKKLYALRDVTATVDCIPLITASILSKKLAEGIDGLVLDVKCGSGAFMKSARDAESLAETMVEIGSRMGKHMVARLTNMDQPLGVMVGNALEVHESLDVLEGRGPADIRALTVELGAEMLVIGRAAHDLDEGRRRIEQVLDDGRAMEKLRDIIAAQRGDPRVIDDRSLLPSTAGRHEVTAARGGFVHAIDTEQVGIASMLLGGGRARAEDDIDPRVGVEVHVRLGDEVKAGQTLFVMHIGDSGIDAAAQRLSAAVRIDDAPASSPALFGLRLERAPS